MKRKVVERELTPFLTFCPIRNRALKENSLLHKYMNGMVNKILTTPNVLHCEQTIHGKRGKIMQMAVRPLSLFNLGKQRIVFIVTILVRRIVITASGELKVLRRLFEFDQPIELGKIAFVTESVMIPAVI